MEKLLEFFLCFLVGFVVLVLLGLVTVVVLFLIEGNPTVFAAIVFPVILVIAAFIIWSVIRDGWKTKMGVSDETE